MTNEKRDTSLSMYINDDIIRVGDLVSYNLIDMFNKARFEPLPSNKWTVRKIIKKDIIYYLRVRHFDIWQIYLNSKLSNFKKVKLN